MLACVKRSSAGVSETHSSAKHEMLGKNYSRHQTLNSSPVFTAFARDIRERRLPEDGCFFVAAADPEARPRARPSPESTRHPPAHHPVDVLGPLDNTPASNGLSGSSISRPATGLPFPHSQRASCCISWEDEGSRTQCPHHFVQHEGNAPPQTLIPLVARDFPVQAAGAHAFALVAHLSPGPLGCMPIVM